ncbi:MAG TPA: FtsW/RodA/SpoVE family cell cycle protein [Gemmatimonadales bacterium]
MSGPAIRHPGEHRWEVRLLAVVAATLTVFGIANLYGAASMRENGFMMMMKQLIIGLIGGIGMLLVSRLDYRKLRPLAWPALGGALVLLLIPILPEGLTSGLSPTLNGARRWVYLPGFGFQPSEVAKFVLVVWAAALAAKKGSQIRQFKKGVLPFLVIIGLVCAMIMQQPNLSTATLVALLGAVVLFTAGAKIGHFILLAGAAGLVVFQLVLVSDYRRARLETFFGRGTEDSGMQITQSMIAVGSGGIVGTGFGQGKAKLAHVPYANSDFLFSSIGEEWGFIGVTVVALLFGVFGWLGYRIARSAPDAFGQYLATGLVTAVALTAVLHMAVTLKLMPTTGLTLPFMSHGGSSLLMNLLATGVLVSIGRLRGRPSAT